MITMILNDGPYGTERSYNGLRLANALAKADEKVQIYLVGDAVVCAQDNQETPKGFYNVERMIESLLSRGGDVHV